MSPILLRRLSDEQLGGRLAIGEAAAFDELYRRYAHRLAAYGAHLLGDGAAGDDVAQSTLLKAYSALRDGRGPAQIRPWLYRIAHNAAIDLVKRRRELPIGSVPERAAPSGAVESGALVAALAALPDRQRHVYVLRELHGLRIDETAAELDLTGPQVEQALFAARNRLAEHLVFGDRLNCVAVRRLAGGPLDLAERRALHTHLRSCSSCRDVVGVRGRLAGSLPLAPLEWLRGLGGLLVGAGAPAAAKVGVVVVGATVAGMPMALEPTNPRPHQPLVVVRHPVHSAPVRQHATASPPVVSASTVLRPSPTAPARVVSRLSHSGGRPHIEHREDGAGEGSAGSDTSTVGGAVTAGLSDGGGVSSDGGSTGTSSSGSGSSDGGSASGTSSSDGGSSNDGGSSSVTSSSGSNSSDGGSSSGGGSSDGGLGPTVDGS